jgi:multidrug efflux pump subunit AcrA (membrane-fusion protein)/DNA-binding NarL/FixJ family response regulator
MTRILLVDDQALLCEVLQTWLEAEEDFQVVGRAENGKIAIAQVEALKPDVVLMDIEMPIVNGIEATRIISDRFPDTKIVVLSACDDVPTITEALRAGARGYQLKTVKAKELANTVRYIARGCNQIELELLKKVVATVPATSINRTLNSTEPASSHSLDTSPPEWVLEAQEINGRSEVQRRLTISVREAPETEAEAPLQKPIRQASSKLGLENPVEEILSSSDRWSFVPLPKFVSTGKEQTSGRLTKLKDIDAFDTGVARLDQEEKTFPKQRNQKNRQNGSLVRITLLTGLGLFVFLGWFFFWRDRDRPDPKPKVSQQASPLPVKTTEVELVNSYQESRFYTGTVAARRSSEVGFEQPGEITRIVVDEGDRVSRGEPIAYLDTTNLEISRRELQARRAQAVARLKEMQAGSRSQTIASARASVRDLNEQLTLARQKSRRRKSLYAEGAIAREQLDETVNNQSVLQARLERAQSQLDELLAGTRPEQIEAQKSVIEQYDANIARTELQLQKNVLKAPFAAIVSERLIDEGTVVSAGQAVLRLVENKALEVRIGVPANAADRISRGSYQKLQIEQKNYHAKVSSILPELDANTRTLTVVLTLDESLATKVSPGQIARLNLVETIPDSGYWLPITALVRGTRGLWSCYVLSEPAGANAKNAFSLKRRDVEVLHTESDRVLVRGTLQKGDRVILNGTHRLVPGQLVRPI